ncbi:MAG: response regulator PilR [Verrucomicrobia bacterium]|nr:MAG: response regulator PilR [Verrucomicrobiota bacterium]
MARVLIIDDDPAMVQVISDLCVQAGHTPIPYTSGARALEFMRGHAPELIITDVLMEGVSGIDVLHAARALLPQVPVVLISASKQLEVVVQGMRAGAFDYVLKPFKVDEFLAVVRRSLDENASVEGQQHNASGAREHLRFENIIGKSPRMREVFGLIEKVANTDSTILIGGESGTGKELVARALHFKSERKAKPFVAINCSALPENLLESELFGHKKGAFTGAVQDKVGLFEEAEGGTVFLDEINSMAPLLQTKLLRVLQERTVRRVGDNRTTPIHVRVLAATNEPLHDKLKTGGFRQDLYYRLAVIQLEIPALRQRADDIPLLVEHFLRKHSYGRSRGEYAQIDGAASHALCSYDWPGNVRELENAMERACVLCDHGLIQMRDLPSHVQDSSFTRTLPLAFVEGGGEVDLNSVLLPIGKSLEYVLSTVERRFIEETLLFNEGIRERAAHMLGISTATLYRKIENERRSQSKGAVEQSARSLLG